jgi:hypothetical protein
MRVSGRVQKGFERSQFEDAWRRYLGGGQETGQRGETMYPPTDHPLGRLLGYKSIDSET